MKPSCHLLHAYTPTRSLRYSAHLLVEPVLELHLLLVVSDLPDHKFRTLYQLTQTCCLFLLVHIHTQNSPIYFNSSPSQLSVPLIRCHTRFCVRYKCSTLHYISQRRTKVDDIYWCTRTWTCKTVQVLGKCNHRTWIVLSRHQEHKWHEKERFHDKAKSIDKQSRLGAQE